MSKPRIRHIAINVRDREKAAQYYQKVFQLEEKTRGPNASLSDTVRPKNGGYGAGSLSLTATGGS